MFANSEQKQTPEKGAFLPIYRLDTEKMAFLNVSF